MSMSSESVDLVFSLAPALPTSRLTLVSSSVKRCAKRSTIALARSGCALRTPLRHPGRRVVHGSCGARSLRRSLYRALELIFQINGYLPLFDRVDEIGHGLKMALT